MRFPLRDFTNQYISASYQDVLQQYFPSDTFYVLDGYGNVVFTLSSASVGQMLITSNMTASMTVATASYVQTSSYTNILTQSSSYASSSLSASYSLTSSYAENSDNADFSLASYYATTAGTASYLYGNAWISQSIEFNPSMSIPPWKEGRLFWDNTNHTLGMYSDQLHNILQVGQETWIRVIAGEYIPDGSPVYISSSYLTFPIVKLAKATGTGTVEHQVVGLATGFIISGSQGYITVQGRVNDVNTSMFPAGTSLFLSHEQSGSFIDYPPPNPYERVLCGYSMFQDSINGKVLVNIVSIPEDKQSFVGLTTVPIITSLGSSSFVISTASVNLNVRSDGTGIIKNYTLPSASFTLNTSSFLDAQHIIAVYNNGNPIYQLVTDRNSVDSIQSTYVATLTPGAGGAISQVMYDTPGVLLANKLLNRIGWTHGIERGYGCLLGESGSRYVTVTSGSVWMGVNNIILSSINSSTNRLILVSHNGGIWSGSLITQYVNDVCDNGTNLVPLTGNKYVVNWVYRGVGSQNSTIIILGPEQAKLSDAQSSQPPSLPSELNQISFLIGRAIYQHNVSTATQIDSAFSQLFVPSVSDHNDLIGLQGGSTGEYYHLTAAEHARLQTWSASWASSSLTSISSSYSDRSLTASYAENASGFTLISGSFYPVSTSWAISASWAPGSGVSTSASYALTASYALNAGQSGGTTLTTGSFYPVTSSWSTYALTASYVNVIPSGSTESASYALTASYASNIGGLSIPPYDYSNIVYSGPNSQIGTCTYRMGGISGSIVAEVTAIYSGNIFIGVSKSLG